MFVNKEGMEKMFSTGWLTFLQCFTFNNDKEETSKSSLYTQVDRQDSLGFIRAHYKALSSLV